MDEVLDPVRESAGELVVVDVVEAHKGFAVVEAGLDALAAKYKGVVCDVTTTAGMEVAKKIRADVRDRRYKVQNLVKDAKAWLNDQKDALMGRSDMIIERLEAIEKPWDEQIKAEETRRAAAKAEKERIERERLARITDNIAHLRSLGGLKLGMTSDDVRERIDSIPALMEADFGDLLASAQRTRDEVVETLEAAYTTLAKQEAEARLLREQAEAAERERAAMREQALREEAARERAASIERAINVIRGVPMTVIGKSSATIDAAVKSMDDCKLEPALLGDRYDEAVQAREDALTTLRAMRDAASEVEQMRAERQRREQEAAAALAAQQAEAAAAAAPVEPAAPPVPGLFGFPAASAAAWRDTAEPVVAITSQIDCDVPGDLARVTVVESPAIAEAEKFTLKLGTICERLSFKVGEDLMVTLGYTPHIDRNAKLFRESDFAGICEAISAHVLAVGAKFKGQQS